MAKPALKFKQIISAAWHTEGRALTYTIYGLTEDGNVYMSTKSGWRKQNMAEATQSGSRVEDNEPF